MTVPRVSLYAALGLLLVAASGPSVAMPAAGLKAPGPSHRLQARARHKIGLGNILSTKDGGQIFGFDINQFGNDGVLASAQTVSPSGETLVSMETFDQDTGKITKLFAHHLNKRDSYSVDGIFAGDVALVTHYIIPKGTIYAKREYQVMNPVTAEKFTGVWTPTIKDIDVQQASTDQTSATAALFAIELKNQDNPIVVVTNVGANTVSKVIKIDPNLLGLGNGPQFAQYTAANQAVIAFSPDGGAVGGKAPVNMLIDLSTGKTSQFTGYNNGFYHAGYVNGIAADPNTGVAVTTTELNSQVEFYDLNTKSGIVADQLPCTTDTSQTTSGSGIAVDPVNKLFLVTEQEYFAPPSCRQSSSAIVVYDESGNYVETIPGFKFAIGESAPVLNPSKRMGWAFGPGFNQLQQFFY